MRRYQLLGRIVKAVSSVSVETDKKKRSSKKQTSTNSSIARPLCDSLTFLVEVVKRMAGSDEHLVSVTRIAVDGLLCEGKPAVQELCVR